MTSSQLTAGMFSTPSLRHIFSESQFVQAMLDVEAALTRVLAAQKIIPSDAVAAIEACCKAEKINIPKLIDDAAAAGNLAIPLVKQLTHCVAQQNADSARYVHWGATSQDIIDTATILQLRRALHLIEKDIAVFSETLAALAKKHSHTVMMGRTWMQHALPVTFGLKVAAWLDAVHRHQDRLSDCQSRLFVLQFGGAAGTLASLGDQGLVVAHLLAKELDLALPDMPWHTQRDRVVEVATVLGLITGSLGKIARDIALHSQTEIAELAEPSAPGRGGSSAMPHKRNPVGCAAVLTAAHRVPGLVATMLSSMVQEQERALGGWQAEWDTLPEIVSLCGAALSQLNVVMQGLQVQSEKMLSNIDVTHGLVMAEAVTLALAHHIGKEAAHHCCEEACALAISTNSHLIDILKADKQCSAHLSEAEIEKCFDSLAYIGESIAFVEKVLATHEHRKSVNHSHGE
jgi:3-carboxy-cis,cis-muconate cycloisomerase